MDNLTEVLCSSGAQGTEPWAGEVSPQRNRCAQVPRDGVMCARVGLLGWAHLLGLSELSVGFTDAGALD